MPSPFPGMNPYLEQEDAWQDFHQRFITFAAGAIARQTRPNYIVKIEAHVYVHELDAGERRLVGRGDIGVASAALRPTGPALSAVLDTPAHVRIPGVDMERQDYLEIRDRQDRTLVTVVELLSPSNKRPGADRQQYLTKRSLMLASPVHVVELDFLRLGPRLPLEGLPACDYYALVSRAETRPDAEVWPFGIRDRLPEIPIPLRLGDGDARLDLRDVLDRAYDEAGYDDYVYHGIPSPSLAPADAAWASDVLATAQK